MLTANWSSDYLDKPEFLVYPVPVRTNSLPLPDVCSPYISSSSLDGMLPYACKLIIRILQQKRLVTLPQRQEMKSNVDRLGDLFGGKLEGMSKSCICTHLYVQCILGDFLADRLRNFVLLRWKHCMCENVYYDPVDAKIIVITNMNSSFMILIWK